ncbi:MAG: SpoIID/LytB domain-containing protein [Luteitalea sp.]|nr:SpoIID/LytB domain-containing protein [Luteitalea sp.]
MPWIGRIHVVRLLSALCAFLVGLTSNPRSEARPAAQDPTPSGTIRIGVQRSRGYDVVALPIEAYIGRVLAGEALPGSDPAALEALAIAIRTYSTANRERHRVDGFDLCDQTHCQVMRTATLATERAATATAGRILWYDGIPASVFYSASCGGRTEKPSNVWPGAADPPYLPSRADDGCGGSPEWTADLTLGDLKRAFAAAGYRGTLTGLRVVGHNESGRVARLALDGLTPRFISGQDLRMAVGPTLGWRRIQSTAFKLRRSGDGYRFEGHGAGHGVGMCVIGSSKLAAAGESAQDILARYFPGAEIGELGGTRPTSTALARPVPAVDSVLTLPESDEGERAAIVPLIQRESDAVARALGLNPPARVVARFHPSVEAYERGSGQPWFTLGATINSELHLLPLAVLRDRGVLERTVRHELVHLMTDAAFAGRPAWVREGAAIHFAQGGTGSTARVSCPSDAELLRPVSAGALSDASTRARACFERQLAAGRTWREVR